MASTVNGGRKEQTLMQLLARTAAKLTANGTLKLAGKRAMGAAWTILNDSNFLIYGTLPEELKDEQWPVKNGMQKRTLTEVVNMTVQPGAYRNATYDLGKLLILYYWAVMATLAYADANEITRVLGSKFYDVRPIIAQQANSLAYPPTYLVLDHLSRSIVVLIRGTNSSADWITDLIGDDIRVGTQYVELQDIKCMHSREQFRGSVGANRPSERWRTHVGFYLAATHVYEKLIPRLDEWLADSRYSNYGIKVVGHSYGAGTASILHILLYQRYFCQQTLVNGCTIQPLAVLFETPPVWNAEAVEIINQSNTQVSVANAFDLVMTADKYRVVKMLRSGAEDTDIPKLHVPGEIYWFCQDSKTERLRGLFQVDWRHPRFDEVMLAGDSSVKKHPMTSVLANVRACIQAATKDPNEFYRFYNLPQSFLCGVDPERDQEGQESWGEVQREFFELILGAEWQGFKTFIEQEALLATS